MWEKNTLIDNAPDHTLAVAFCVFYGEICDGFILANSG